MAAPLIGITLHAPADPDRATLDTLINLIAQGVDRAGGLPVFIPLGLTTDTLHALYARLDGVLFSGGGDIGPVWYGLEPHPTMSSVDPERDRTEMLLARWAANEPKPFFGICRGTQVINVALGGTLFRDVGEHPGAHKHSYDASLESTLRAHDIQVQEDTRLAEILGQPVLRVNSLHHQAVRQAAPGLSITARSSDGIVEAVEMPEHPFGLAVQWHPECLPDAPEQRRLFEAFVRAARSKA